MNFLRNGEALCLALFFALAGFFATFHLTESPPVWYDEGFYVQSAANLAEYGQTGLRVSPDTIEASSKLITVGYPLIYPLAGWFEVFGVSIFSARIFMVLFILGFLVTSYALARRLFGVPLALGALALLATLPTLYGNGKNVLGEVPGLMYLALFLLCFCIARAKPKKLLWFALAGVFAGLCVVTKPIFLLLLPAIAVGVGFEWWRGALKIKEILIAAAAGLVPMLIWFLLQFQAGDTLTSVLDYYANPYQIENLSGTIVANISSLFTGVGALYLMGVMAVWIVAIGVRLRARESIYAEEVIALVFSLLIIAAYTRTAGWYRYLFEAQAVALVFFPYAALVVARQMRTFFDPKKIVATGIVLLALSGVYQILFNSWVADSYGGTRTAFWEEYFVQISPETSHFFYNAPEVALFVRGSNYFQYIKPAGGAIGGEQLAVVEHVGVDRVILETDTYEAMSHELFAGYTVVREAHGYTFLDKI